MPDGTKPPRDFLDWLEATYNNEDVALFKLHYVGPGVGKGIQQKAWERTPQYLYWKEHIYKVDLTEVQNELSLLSLGGVKQRIQELEDTKKITPEQAGELRSLYGIASPLAQREMQINLSNAINQVLNSPLVPDEEKALIMGDEGRRLQEVYLSGESNEIVDVLEGMIQRANIKQPRQVEVSNKMREALKYASGEYLAWLGGDEAKRLQEAYVSGEEPQGIILSYLENIAVRGKSLGEQRVSETDRVINTMAGLAQRPQQAEWQRPPLPGTEEVTKSFLEGTGLAAGTKLRSYLEGTLIPGKGIPETIAQTAEARQRWWEQMNRQPSPDVAAGLAMGKEELTGLGELWKSLPSQKVTGEVAGAEFAGAGYFEPSGLKGMVERAYRQKEGILGQQTAENKALVAQYEREGYPGQPKPEPDPLLEALKKKKYRAEYFRQPGAGLRNVLTPAVRY